MQTMMFLQKPTWAGLMMLLAPFLPALFEKLQQLLSGRSCLLWKTHMIVMSSQDGMHDTYGGDDYDPSITRRIMEFIIRDVVEKKGSEMGVIIANGGEDCETQDGLRIRTAKVEYSMASGSRISLEDGVTVEYSEETDRKLGSRMMRRSSSSFMDDVVPIKTTRTRTLKLIASGHDAPQRLTKALDRYMDAIRKEDLMRTKKSIASSVRYIYTPQSTGSSESEENRRYARFSKTKLDDGFKLSHATTPRLDEVLRKLNSVKKPDATEQHRTSVPPQRKLGFILYGPPGTGKTTWVHALANHLGRHIIMLNLEEFMDNQAALHNLLCTSPIRFKTDDDDDYWEELDHSDVVLFIDEGTRYANIMMDVERDESVPIKVTSVSEYNKLKVQQARMLTNRGLLTMLDGITGTPGRIIVMCTNDEKLEMISEATARAGRLGDMKIRMSFLDSFRTEYILREFFGAAFDEEATPGWSTVRELLDSGDHHLSVNNLVNVLRGSESWDPDTIIPLILDAAIAPPSAVHPPRTPDRFVEYSDDDDDPNDDQ